MELQQRIESLYDAPPQTVDKAEALRAFNEFKFFLNNGELRAAEQRDGEWHVNRWVKKGILLGFRLGVLTDVSINTSFR